MRLRYCILNGDRQVFHGDMIVVKQVFPSLFYHCLMESKFSVEKITLVPTMTLCIKTVVNMEEKHPLNPNKFHIFVKFFLSCP